MKRIIIVFISLVFIRVFSFSQNFLLDGSFPFTVTSGLDGIRIEKNTLTYIYYSPDKSLKKSVGYSFVHIDGMPFLKFDEPFPVEVTEKYLYGNEKDFKTDDKMLLLAGLLEDKKPFIIGTTAGFDEKYPSSMPSFFEGNIRAYREASSTLVEGNVIYSVKNLCNEAVDTPWVEAAPGYGIGESFIIENFWNQYYPYLLIMNGYISYQKPYLYKQNGRVKAIKVTGLTSGVEEIVTVLDTPHPQTIDISFIKEPEDIKITIVSVYKGTKYEDTCIHYCITFNKKVIPYEDNIGE